MIISWVAPNGFPFILGRSCNWWNFIYWKLYCALDTLTIYMVKFCKPLTQIESITFCVTIEILFFLEIHTSYDNRFQTF
jgi:hypothetical protein